MVTQLRAMSLSASSAELCVDEEVSVDPSEGSVWLSWLWGEVPTKGNEAVGVIEW